MKDSELMTVNAVAAFTWRYSTDYIQVDEQD